MKRSGPPPSARLPTGSPGTPPNLTPAMLSRVLTANGSAQSARALLAARRSGQGTRALAWAGGNECSVTAQASGAPSVQAAVSSRSSARRAGPVTRRRSPGGRQDRRVHRVDHQGRDDDPSLVARLEGEQRRVHGSGAAHHRRTVAPLDLRDGEAARPQVPERSTDRVRHGLRHGVAHRAVEPPVPRDLREGVVPGPTRARMGMRRGEQQAGARRKLRAPQDLLLQIARDEQRVERDDHGPHLAGAKHERADIHLALVLRTPPPGVARERRSARDLDGHPLRADLDRPLGPDLEGAPPVHQEGRRLRGTASERNGQHDQREKAERRPGDADRALQLATRRAPRYRDWNHGWSMSASTTPCDDEAWMMRRVRGSITMPTCETPAPSVSKNTRSPSRSASLATGAPLFHCSLETRGRGIAMARYEFRVSPEQSMPARVSPPQTYGVPR